MKQAFVRGDIVTDIGEDSHFYNWQGQVSRFYLNGTVIVRFPVLSAQDHIFWRDETPKMIRVTYKPERAENLRRDEGWDQLVRAEYETKKLFNNRWFSLRYNLAPFEKGTKCQIKGCPNVAVGRSFINYVGTVYTLDLCKKHKQEWWSGRQTTVLPRLKKAVGLALIER